MSASPPTNWPGSSARCGPIRSSNQPSPTPPKSIRTRNWWRKFAMRCSVRGNGWVWSDPEAYAIRRSLARSPHQSGLPPPLAPTHARQSGNRNRWQPWSRLLGRRGNGHVADFGGVGKCGSRPTDDYTLLPDESG